MKNNGIEDIEIHLLLEAVFKRYGHDFRDYAKSTINRRVNEVLRKSDCNSIIEMTQKVLHDESFFQFLLTHLSITVTEWFRDPLFYLQLRQKVLPYLKTFPFIKIWHAGCSTGEEAYSFSVISKEEGLYNKSTIFATDFNDEVLSKAKQGIYSETDMEIALKNYQKSGGTQPLSNYIHAKYDSVIVSSSLKKNITFSNHNLSTDSVFGEMHLISCRNVMIYFNKALKNRVLKLFHDSLTFKGFLCLGSKESLDFTDISKHYKIIDKEQKIYQKISR
jgi:chemotaxis protein methyltransferase CheR